jgi:UDP-N-acetylglucosamine/UDP-N-acetylgalactosamine 4-epimerase
MKALVTGGAGFIGSNIAERLLREGNSVTVLDNFSSGKVGNLSFLESIPGAADRFTLVRGDITDYRDCLGACGGAEVVFHEAALRSVPKSMENPEEYNRVNIGGTLNMLRAARESGVKRFVFASSSSVYGESQKFPEAESDQPLLISPYALTKLAGEYYCRVFSRNYGLETAALRYFNVFGKRQSMDDEYAVVIPKFIDCLLRDENPPVHGTGEQSRDFTHVDNVVEANLLAGTVKGIRGEVFNVATGSEYSVISIVDILNKLLAKDVKPVFNPLRAGDVPRSLADISKINRMLGYSPVVSFQEGLEKTMQWYKDLKNGPSREQAAYREVKRSQILQIQPS